jgi:hypothetical protein
MGGHGVPDQRRPEKHYSALEQLEGLRSNLNVKATPQIQRVADAFKKNIERILDLGRLPGEMFNRGIYYVKLQEQLKKDRQEMDWTNIDEATREAMFAEVIDKNTQAHGLFYASPLGETWSKYPSEVDALADAQYESEMTALMSSMIVNAWTAFEVLAKDLWVAAIDAHPDRLVELGGCKNRIENFMRDSNISGKKTPRAKKDAKADHENDKEDTQEKTSEQSIKVSHMIAIAKGDFNFGDKMGRLLVLLQDFSTLNGMRSAYSRAFSHRSKRVSHIDSALGDWAIDALHAIRNLLEHNGGIADYRYEERLKYVPNIPKLDLGERLEVDGRMASGLMKPVISQGIALINAVSKWLEVN